jgi:hypothetical protein
MLVALSRFIKSGDTLLYAAQRYPRIAPIASQSCCNFDQIPEHSVQRVVLTGTTGGRENDHDEL